MFGRQRQQFSMFVLGGWLFADLFIGLALLFFVGNTQPVPKILPTPTPSPTNAPTPTPTPEPILSTSVTTIQMTLPETDVSGLIANDSGAVNRFQNEVLQQLQVTNLANKANAAPLANYCAGLVIPYGGDPVNLYGTPTTIGPAMVSALQALGKASGARGQFFKVAVYHEPQILLGSSYGSVKLEIYVYTSQSPCLS